MVAHSPTAAANAVRDDYRLRPETEITAFGPFGGETTRYVGWHTAIGQALLTVDRRQLPLF